MISLVVLGLVFAGPFGYWFGYQNAVPFYESGFRQGISEMQKAFDSAGHYSNVEFNDDGSVTLTILGANGATAIRSTYRLDLIVQHYREGRLIDQSIHALSLTNFGLDWLADNAWNSGGANITKTAMYLSTSASTDVFSAAWDALPAEVTSNGLERSLATWTDTGTGTGNLTKSFSVTGTQSVQLYGVNIDSYANTPFGLVAAEQQGAGAVKNCINGDTLTLTVMCTAAGA